MNEAPVLVAGGNVGGLAAARSLHARGLRVVALSYDDGDLTRRTRAVAEIVETPHPGRDEDAFVERLLELGPRWEGALLLETGDYPAAAFGRNRDALAEWYRLVTPPWPMLETFLRKDLTAELAERCGVPAPITRPSVGDRTDLTGIPFPCIVKPVLGHTFYARFGTKVFVVDDEAELRSTLARCAAVGEDVVVQEIVEGADGDVHQLHVYVDSTGDWAAEFHHRKLRQNPPGFGVMAAGVSTEPDREVRELAHRLLDEVDFRGVCDVELRRDRRDGRLKLIEVNARLPRTTWFATACGVDLPWLIHQDLVAGRPITVDSYEVGVHGIELVGELARVGRARGTHRPGLRAWLAPYRSGTRTFAVADRHDARPLLHQVRAGAGQVVRRQQKRR